MKSPRKKQFVNFKLHAVLSSVMKSPTVLLCPTYDVTFVQSIHTLYPTCLLSYLEAKLLGITVLVFK